MQVLKANGIEALTMHGSMSQKKRMELLRQFRECDRRGARVLLISNVDSVGLNIACANIVIIVVRKHFVCMRSEITDVGCDRTSFGLS